MFYDETEINNILNCPMCEVRYEEPKQLPCGKIICNYCVAKLDKEFNCSFCLKVHQIPPESFPTCDLISRLLQTKPNKVFRGENIELLKSNLNDIQKTINEFSFKIDHEEDCIKEHCLNLRREVQLATETVINQVNEKSEQMINQISKYEKERIKELKNSKEKKAVLIKTIDELKQYYNKWSDYIKNFMVNETKVKSANCLAQELKTKTNRQRASLKKLLFNGQYLEYSKCKKDIAANILGSLVSPMEIGPYETFNRIDIKDLIPQDISFKVEPFNDENYLIGYCSNKGIITFKVIDRNKKILKSVDFYRHANNFEFSSQKTLIVVSYTVSNKCYLETFDENLREMHIIALKYCFWYKYNLATTNSNIYRIFYDEEDDGFSLSIYNWNLQLIKSIGQSKYKNNPFYFPSNIIKFEVKNGKYFWLNSTSFNIVDELNGTIDLKIILKAINFMINSKNEIILISSDNKIFYFDFNGEKLFESNLENFPGNLSSFINSNDEIGFYDSSKLNILYCD